MDCLKLSIQCETREAVEHLQNILHRSGCITEFMDSNLPNVFYLIVHMPYYSHPYKKQKTINDESWR